MNVPAAKTVQDDIVGNHELESGGELGIVLVEHFVQLCFVWQSCNRITSVIVTVVTNMLSLVSHDDDEPEHHYLERKFDHICRWESTGA